MFLLRLFDVSFYLDLTYYIYQDKQLNMFNFNLIYELEYSCDKSSTMGISISGIMDTSNDI